MRGWLFVLFAAAVAAGPVFAGKEPELVIVTSDDGTFAVKFVTKNGRVPEDKTTVKVPGGKLTVNSMTASPSRDVTMTIHWTDFGDETDVSDAAKVFDAARDAVKGAKGKVQDERELSPLVAKGADTKVPGREYRIDQSDKLVRFRLFLHGKRLYQITVAGSKKEATADWTDAFLKSFVVLN